ncbi:MAG: hypothetical protein K2N13_05200 [Paraprevotella sp.]|nr:hypothetical protein [Paraprevotella sp.]
MFAKICFNGSNRLIASDKWFSHPSAFLHLSFSFSRLPTQMFAEKGFNGSNRLIASDKWFIYPSVFPPTGSADGCRGAPQAAIPEPLFIDNQQV